MTTPSKRTDGGAQPAGRRSSGVLFGHVLREARTDARMTQRALAEATGVTEDHVSLLERGKRSPGLETLLRLSRALGVAPGVLVDPVAEEWEVEP